MTTETPSADVLTAIAAGPAGPRIGAFFDLDGTAGGRVHRDRSRRPPYPPPPGSDR